MNLHISNILTTFAVRCKPMQEMTNIKYITLSACALLTWGACSSEGGGSDNPVSPTPPAEKLPIRINTIINSRATDDDFEMGDNMGLFVVNHNSNGSASILKPTGNYIDNFKFTYLSSTWSSATPIYWKDENTHADFYMYYPYISNIRDVTTMPWNVKADQSKLSDYKASDLLIGETTNVAPTASAVNINVKHMMSQIIITLVAGKGFTESSLAAANISVKVNHLKNNATVHLSTGEVRATGDFTTIIPLKENGRYKAIIIPQTVDAENLITVNVDGTYHNLANADDFHAFETGKSHKFTATIDKTSNGVNVSIMKWEDDGSDYGGNAELSPRSSI